MRKVFRKSLDSDFERVLVAELNSLKQDEGRLMLLYPKLRNQPKLQERFQLDLSELRRRVDRLYAVLSPLYDIGPTSARVPNISPAA